MTFLWIIYDLLAGRLDPVPGTWYVRIMVPLSAGPLPYACVGWRLGPVEFITSATLREYVWQDTVRETQGLRVY